jgi:hypothetical protein
VVRSSKWDRRIEEVKSPARKADMGLSNIRIMDGLKQ